jgi:hypothetical protein
MNTRIAIDIAALKAMVAAGATAEMVIAALEAAQANADAVAKARQKKDAARKRKERASKTSSGHRVTSRDIADENEGLVGSASSATQDVASEAAGADPPGAIPPKEKSPHTPLKEKDLGGGARARARGLQISKEAFAFADELAGIAGYDDLKNLPARWMNDQPAVRIQMMFDAGWVIDVMRETAIAAIRKKRDGPPFSVKYFEPIFARAHAPQLPLPAAQIVKPTGSTEAFYAQATPDRPATGWQASRDRGRAAHAELKARIAASDGGG